MTSSNEEGPDSFRSITWASMGTIQGRENSDKEIWYALIYSSCYN